MKISRLIVLVLCVAFLFTAVLPHSTYALDGITTLSEEPVIAAESDFTYIAAPKNKPRYALVTEYTGSDKKIIIPETIDGYPVQVLSSYVFKNCTELTYVRLPLALTSVSGQTFAECRSLTEIEVHPENTTYISDDGILYNSDKTTIVAFPNGIGGDYTIPDHVTTIGSYAFSGAYLLENVTMGNNVTGISNGAFSGCYNMDSIRLSDHLSVLGSKALEGCLDLRELHLPASLQSIGNDAVLGHLNSYDQKEYYFTDGVYCVKGSKAYDYIHKLGIRAPYLKTEARTITDLKTGVKLIDTEGVLPLDSRVELTVKPLGTSDIVDLIPTRFSKLLSYKLSLTVDGEAYTPDTDLIIQFNSLPENTVTNAAKVYRIESEEAYELIRSPHTPFVGAQTTDLGTYAIVINNDFSMPGDIDGDGIVSSYDARFALCIAAGLVSDITDEQLATANTDSSNDGVSTDDARNILRYAAGIIDTFE